MKTRTLAPPWRLLVVLFFLLPALLPLLNGNTLPCTHDNDLHYYRIAAIDAAWQQGWIFSRWVPNLALGYGYPFFNYREPLPYLVGALLYQTGLPLPLVLGLLYAASFVAATWGAYVWARDLFGDRAAWIAALAYGLGPYLLLDALRRGNMPESVALALLPWLLVTFRRVILGGGRGPFIASVLLLVALFLSHNISSLLFAPLLGGYVIVLAWVYRARKAWPWAFVAVLLAVMLTAWFWFPALTQQSTVQLHLSRTTRNNDFHYNFAAWREMLFSLPTPYDPDFINLPMRVPLGVVQTVLAVAGVVIGWWRTCAWQDARNPADSDAGDDTGVATLRANEIRGSIIFFALAALGYLWMSSPGSVWLWEAFPLLAFIQFPWRLVGRALLPVSLLSAAAFTPRPPTAPNPRPLTPNPSLSPRLPSTVYRLLSTVARRFAPRLPFYLTLVLLPLASWPNTYPPKGFCAMASYPSMADLYAYEQRGWMGVDPEGSYFPVWVEARPADTMLADAFARGAEPERLDASVLPEDARVLAADYRPLRATINLDTPKTFRARWLGFYFPGWQVEIDGTPVAIAPEARTGLLTFNVPAGQHTIDVYFGMTPAWATAGIVSAVGLLLFGLATWRSRSVADARPAPEEAALAEYRFPWALAVLSVLLLVLKLLVVDRTMNPLRYSRLAAGELPEVAPQMAAQPFSGGLTLLGYEVAAAQMPADGEVQIDLLWQARDIPTEEYHAVVLLIGADGQRWSPPGAVRPRGYEPTPPTTMWLPGQYAYDPHIVEALPGTPPGEYSIVVSLFDRQTLAPASVLDADGNPTGPELTLGTLTVTPPAKRPSLQALDVPVKAVLQHCDALGLWTLSADRISAAPGEIVGLRWVWEATEVPSEAVEAELMLLDSTGAVARTWHLPPSAAWWPTDRWSAGERWVGRPIIRLPGGVESGAYRLIVCLPGCDGVLAEVPLDIVAPERVWRAPTGLVRAGVVYGDVVRLIGYTLDPATPAPGETLSVRLAWQAVEEMEASYRVFVHFVGEDGRVVAQSDGEPVDWTRPTTGWAVGEVVVETREITVPATLPSGEYTLRAGLYLPDGARLLTVDAQDAFVLWRDTLNH
ncbi:MAG: 6-pyruvoyl-tetrahydropterin synthase-related protein [Anaerolineae bacterium]